MTDNQPPHDMLSQPIEDAETLIAQMSGPNPGTVAPSRRMEAVVVLAARH